MGLTVVLDSVDPRAVLPFWEEALGYRFVSDLGAFLVLVPRDQDDGASGAPVFLLQQVPEPRSGKNRMHLDVHPPDVPALVARLEELGGRRVGPPVTGMLESIGVWWQVMADPQDNELCVVADPGHPPPAG